MRPAQISLCPNCNTINHRPNCICGFVSVPTLITLEQYFKGLPPTAELEASAKDLLLKVNSLLSEMNCNSVTVTSGYRSPEHNQAIGGATNSNHCKGKAIDLLDVDHALGRRLETNTAPLAVRELYCENLDYTVKKDGTCWLHIQTVRPGSGRRFFLPYAGPPKLA